jgi:hypothetical protein
MRLWVAWSLLTTIPILLAQTPTGAIVGRVLDPSGGVVPAATVIVRHPDTSQIRTTQAGEDGAFAVPLLPPGTYEVIVEKAGFRRLVNPAVTVQAGDVHRLELRLEIGEVIQTVEVRSEPPPTNTDHGTKGDTITIDEKDNMPLPGRSFGDLAYLVAGVGPNSDGGYGSGYIVNGARGDNTNFVVDGVSTYNRRSGKIILTPPLDAMREFRVETSGYSAEYGRLAGGVLTVVLKSGTNRLHGSLFEYLRNSRLDARSAFDPEKAPLRRNQFGATFDGPVVVPRVYDGRNRTFFLVSWESVRQVQGQTRRTRVPSTLERAGDFSRTYDVTGSLIPLVDPLASAGTLFPGNHIPPSHMHPTALQLLEYYPLENRPGEPYNFIGTDKSRASDDHYLAKVDHRFTDRDSVAVRYMRTRSNPYNPYRGGDVPGFGIWYRNRYTLAGLNYQRMLTPTLINEFRAAFTRSADRELRTRFSDKDYGALLGITPPQPDSRLWGFPSINIRDITTIGDTKEFPKVAAVNNWQFADTATWVRGKHLVKGGFDLLRTQYFEPWNRDVRGTLNFQGRWTNIPVGDFLLGLLHSSSLQRGTVTNYLYLASYSGFFQDDYKVSPRLTLNLGLRYELSPAFREKYGRIVNFMPHLGKIVIASSKALPDLAERLAAVNLTGKVVMADELGLPASLTRTRHRDWAPRFGFAWRPFAGTAMVIRGGYGIFFASFMNEPVRKDLGNAYPFVIPESFSRDSRNPNALTLSNAFPIGRRSIGGTANGFGLEFLAPAQYLQSWNFTIERGVGSQAAVEMAYVGSKGTHLGRRYDINQPLRRPELRLPTGAFPRPWQDFSSINYYSFCSNSNYHAGMITIRRRFSGGMFLRANYVFAKNIDESSQISGSGNGSYGGATDARNLKLDRGRADADIRHSFTAAFSFETPRRWGRAARKWRLTGNWRAYTGQPFTPLWSDADLEAGESNRPDRIRHGALPNPTADRWFDIFAFVPVPRGAYRFGNSGRNILDAPGFVSFNVGLLRTFTLVERQTLQFRVEAFNLTNHPNFKLPEINVNRPAAGVIRSAGSPRMLQLALRYQF